MDVYKEASSLRHQLIKLQHSDNNISELEKELSRLNEQGIMTSLEDNLRKHLCVLLRQSITDGVHMMYQQYSTNKWIQIQNTALSIKRQLVSNHEDDMTSLPTPSTVSSHPDRSIEQWSSFFCETSSYE